MTDRIKTDIAIVGAGLAGSLSAAMLEEAGIDHVLIDPRTEYPDEFRCEKFNSEQISLLEQSGLSQPVFDTLTPVTDVWMARYGKLIRKQHYPHYGFSYNTVVNTLREQFVNQNQFIQANVASIDATADRQVLELSNGEFVDARLVVLSSGVARNLQTQLGFQHSMLSERHCLAIGFDFQPEAGSDLPFDTMTYWPEKSSDLMSYLTFFKCGSGWRANLFGYWNIRDERIKKLREEPEACLHDLMPGLEDITGKFTVTEKMRIRSIDLYQWTADNIDGVVAIGDAWASSCPGAGTGTTKALNDALRLCNYHIPQFLETDGMSAGKLAAFYRDQAKIQVDKSSFSEAYKLRSLTLDKNFYWSCQRWLRFLYHGFRGRTSVG